MLIRPANNKDAHAIWAIMEPIVRAGETYTLPRDMDKTATIEYWLCQAHEVFVAEDNGGMVGTYFLQANQQGGGGHVANCGYMTAVSAMGRGVARTMCEHSLGRARERDLGDHGAHHQGGRNLHPATRHGQSERARVLAL